MFRHRVRLWVVAFCATFLLFLSPGSRAKADPGAQSARQADPAAGIPGDKSAGASPNAAHEVNILAVVRDKKGKPVAGLTKEDFTLTEDGHAEALQACNGAAGLPVALGLLFDTSPRQNRVLDGERAATHTFVDTTLREDTDKAFLIHFDREVELLQDFTPSRPKLEQALALLQIASSTTSNSPDDDSAQGRGGRGGGRYHHGSEAQLYDAVYLASNELMRKQPGRKILILLSDGVDRGSKKSLDGALEAAQSADIVLYSIFSKNDDASEGGGNRGGFGFPGGPGMGGGMGRHGGGRGYPPSQGESLPDGKKVLERMSAETGGRLFEVSKKLAVDEIYSSIEEDLRNQYNISYLPSQADDAGGCRRILLSSTKKDAVVQARSSYCSESSR